MSLSFCSELLEKNEINYVSKKILFQSANVIRNFGITLFLALISKFLIVLAGLALNLIKPFNQKIPGIPGKINFPEKNLQIF